jgi:hypothetical protein
MDVISPRDLSDALGELALDLRWTWSHEAVPSKPAATVSGWRAGLRRVASRLT